MKTLTETEATRNFSRVLDEVEHGNEITLVRNGRTVARMIPEPKEQTALEVFGDLYRTLDDETADALSKSLQLIRSGG